MNIQFTKLTKYNNIIKNKLTQEIKLNPNKRLYLYSFGPYLFLCSLVHIGTIQLAKVVVNTTGYIGRPNSTATFDLRDDTKDITYVFDESEAEQEDVNYGNIYSEGVSWKGPAGVLIPYDPTISYGDATTTEETVGFTDYFTPFSSSIYEEGEELEKIEPEGASRPKVLCYGIVANKPRVVLGTNYRDAASPDGDSNGFFEELWEKQDNKWVRISYRQASRAKTPCSFLSDGRVLTQEGLYLLDGSYVPFNHVTGTLSTSGTAWNRFGDVTDWMFRYQDATLDATYSVADSTDVSGSGGVTQSTAPVYVLPPTALVISGGGSVGGYYIAAGGTSPYTFSGSGVTSAGLITSSIGLCAATVTDACGESDSYSSDTLPALIVTGSITPTVGSGYGTNNGIGTISWSFSGGTINSSGTITAITGCGSATISATDECGRTANLDVRLPSGTWVLTISQSASGVLCTCGAPCYSTYITGIYKYALKYYCCRNTETGCISGYLGLVNFSEVDPSIGVCSDPAYCSSTTAGTRDWYLMNRAVYEWRCP